MCRVLQIAPSTYYAHAAVKANPALASDRRKRDIALCSEIKRVHAENFSVYGARKIWHQLKREGIETARCTVERLMHFLAIEGVRRGRSVRTTIRDAAQACPKDKVNRRFKAANPNALWVADFTYVQTWQGFIYVAFIIDVFARYIVGWKVSATANAAFVLDALEQAIHARRPTEEDGLVHHSDHGSQYLAFRYTERLEDAYIIPSVGSVGDSYDNALAETINGLYKAEVIHRQTSWRTIQKVELATLKWVDWFNNRRLLGPIGNITPKEAEERYYDGQNALPLAA